MDINIIRYEEAVDNAVSWCLEHNIIRINEVSARRFIMHFANATVEKFQNDVDEKLRIRRSSNEVSGNAKPF